MVKAYLGTIKRVIQCCLKGELKPCLWELGWRWGYLIGCIRHQSMPFVELQSSISQSRSPFVEPQSSFTESRSELV